MSHKKSKVLAQVFAALLLVSVLSSCNRGGRGCPYDMKIIPSIQIASFQIPSIG